MRRGIVFLNNLAIKERACCYFEAKAAQPHQIARCRRRHMGSNPSALWCLEAMRLIVLCRPTRCAKILQLSELPWRHANAELFV